MWMTALALPGSGGASAHGIAGGRDDVAGSSNKVKGIEQRGEAQAPTPMPTRFRNWRRVRK